MSTLALALVALALSTPAIFLLCRDDPKRRRAAGQGGGATRRARSLLAALACAPALGCIALGNSAAFMLWLGGAALLGWLAAGSFARPVR